MKEEEKEIMEKTYRIKAYYENVVYKSVGIEEDGKIDPYYGHEEVRRGDVRSLEILVNKRQDIRSGNFYIALITKSGEIVPVEEKVYESLDEAKNAAREWSRYLNGEKSETLGEIEDYWRKKQ